MPRLRPVVVVALLAFVFAVPAAAQAPPELVEKIAGALCKGGGDPAACTAQAEEIAAAAIAACQGASDRRSCVQGEAKKRVQEALKASGKGGKGGVPEEAIAKVAAALCKNGGDKAACEAQAKELAAAAATTCASASDRKACMQAELKKLVQAAVKAKKGGGGPSAEVVEKVAKALCKKDVTAECRAKAKELVADAAKACQGSSDRKACTQAEIKKRVKAARS